MADPNASDKLVQDIVDVLGSNNLESLVSAANEALSGSDLNVLDKDLARDDLLKFFSGGRPAYFSEKLIPKPALTSNLNKEYFFFAAASKTVLYNAIHDIKKLIFSRIVESGFISDFTDVDTNCVGITTTTSTDITKPSKIDIKETFKPEDITPTKVKVYYKLDEPNPTQLLALTAAPDKVETFQKFLYSNPDIQINNVKNFVSKLADSLLFKFKVIQQVSLRESAATSFAKGIKIEGSVDIIPTVGLFGQAQVDYDVALASRRAKALSILVSDLIDTQRKDLTAKMTDDTVLGFNILASLSSGGGLLQSLTLKTVSQRNPDGSLKQELDLNPNSRTNIENRNASIEIVFSKIDSQFPGATIKKGPLT
jgi:hypothetical protein